MRVRYRRAHFDVTSRTELDFKKVTTRTPTGTKLCMHRPERRFRRPVCLETAPLTSSKPRASSLAKYERTGSLFGLTDIPMSALRSRKTFISPVPCASSPRTTRRSWHSTSVAARRRSATSCAECATQTTERPYIAGACPSTSELSLSPMSRASRANALNAPPAPAEARAPVLPVLPSQPPHRSGPDACSNARAAILSPSRLLRTKQRWLAGSPPLLDRVTRRRRSSVPNQRAQMQHHSPYRRRRHPSPLTVSNSGVFENIPAQDGAAFLSWLLRRVPAHQLSAV